MIRYFINPKFANVKSLRKYMEALPQSFWQGGKILWNKRNKIKAFDLPTNCDGKQQYTIVVKRFKHLNIIQKLIYFFRPHKARRAFLNGMELVKREVSTPDPIAAVEIKAGLWLKEAFYICDETTLQSIESETDRDDWNRQLAAAFANFVADLHSKGILHNDLNDTNVLYENDENNTYHFSVIDINRMKFYPVGENIPDNECIENLTRFTGRLDLFEFVAREYAKARNLDADAWVAKSLRQKAQHDRNWRRRKALLHPIKYLKTIKKHK